MIRTCQDCGNVDCPKYQLNGRPDDEDCWEPTRESEPQPEPVLNPRAVLATLESIAQSIEGMQKRLLELEETWAGILRAFTTVREERL